MQYNSEAGHVEDCAAGMAVLTVQYKSYLKKSSALRYMIHFLSDRTGRSSVSTPQLMNTSLMVYMEDYLLKLSLRSSALRLSQV